MIQRHKILLNLSFSADAEQTVVVNSNTLVSNNNYQINNIQGLGNGIVNFSNVRAFLNDDVNDFIINDFFSYLTGTTTTVEFAEIYNSDQKLADVFNEYYVSSVLNNQTPSTSVIDNGLTGTMGVTIIENNIYNYDGIAPTKGLNYIPLSIDDATRKLNIYSALTTFTNEESYYVPVFIVKNYRQMARLQFDACDEVVSLILGLSNSGITFNGFGQGFGGSILLPTEGAPSQFSSESGDLSGSAPVAGNDTPTSSPSPSPFSSPSSPAGGIGSVALPSSGGTSPSGGSGSVGVGGFMITSR